MILHYGNYGIFLIMGDAGFMSVSPGRPQSGRRHVPDDPILILMAPV